MQRSQLLVGILILLTLPGSAGAAEPPPTDIDAVFADYDSTTSPGCALGVIRDGELVYKRGYGMANLEYGIALSPRSVFRTGSIGKQFTAMAIALLAEKGTLSLDDPIRRLFPELPDYADEITIRHLIHHTSGLRDYLDLAWMAGFDDEGPYTDEFAIELIARQKNTNFTPGDEHLYSNSGYFLLSHVVQRATGQTLREWAAKNIFDPLGMKDTHYHDDHTHIVPNRADGYALTDDGYKISMTTLGMVGDGGVFTTVEDLLLWDRNFYDNKLGANGQGLTDLVTAPGRLNNGGKLDYAFGLRLAEHHGLAMIRHSGSFVGYVAEMARFPDQRLSVVVLCNRADADPTQRALEVAELYLADLLEPERVAEKSTTVATEADEITAADAELIIGHYWQEDDQLVREIRFEGGRLLFVRPEDSQTVLAPLGNDRFVMVGVPDPVEVRFELTGRTAAKMLVRVGDDEPVTFDSYEKKTPPASELAAHTGTYYSEELEVEYELTLQDGSLCFGFGKPGDQRLEPQFGETFTNPDYGTFEFQRDSQSQIIGFSLGSGRVRNMNFVRK